MQEMMIYECPLVRLGFSKMMKKEFDVDIDYTNCMSVLRAVTALFIYENVEEFFKDTGWDNDNPELCGEAYLIENHICRWIKGKFCYFSRILWQNSPEN